MTDSKTLRCPKCQSTAVAVKSGFDFGKAAFGMQLFGSIGSAAAFASDNPQKICKKCGHKF